MNVDLTEQSKTEVRTFRDIYVKFWFVGSSKLDFKICSRIKSGMPKIPALGT